MNPRSVFQLIEYLVRMVRDRYPASQAFPSCPSLQLTTRPTIGLNSSAGDTVPLCTTVEVSDGGTIPFSSRRGRR